ncbi:MAG: MBL fold metallo-hydrolase [Deltaproteobacteria bacterium]|nr:MBL fold metallo-hydrolase [Deltaproteobacteria bacterium]
MRTTLRIYFLDVGQGDCSLIVLPDNTGILVDCKDEFAATELMRWQQIDHLRAIVVTHLDRDHIAGVPHLLSNFFKRRTGTGDPEYPLRQLDSIWIEEDRTRGNLTEVGHQLLELALARARDADVAQMVPTRDGLPTLDPRPKPVWPLHEGGDWAVELLLPFHTTRREHFMRFGAEGNPVSAAVRVRHGQQRVIIGGDATLGCFEDLFDLDSEQVRANVVRSPHHGGDVLHGTRAWDDYSDFYKHSAPEIVVHSVGTSNAHSHPLAAHVRGSTRAGSCHVMCTQLTAQCHGDVDDVRLRTSHLSLDGTYPHRNRARRGAQRARPPSTPCAGTVLVSLDGEAMTFYPSAEDHGDLVLQLDHPLCR